VSAVPRLYDYAASANCLKVRLLARELELPYERVEVDIFAGDTLDPAFLARNPAGRTPVLELDSGECLAESNAILLYLAEGTSLLPDDLLGHARVWQWLFFEQNLIEPNIGTARFWRLTGRDAAQPEAWRQRREAGIGALGVLERHLATRDWLVGPDFGLADLALYPYTSTAPGADIDLDAFPAVRRWLARVTARPRFVDDLAPYPANASAGLGEGSVHDAGA
jgi:glutathione S-transferase